MHIERRSLRRSVSSLQDQYESRLENPFYRGLRCEGLGPAAIKVVARSLPARAGFKTCQFIEGEPTKAELREFGGDHFKCGAPTIVGKPYCGEHSARCYVRPVCD